MSFSHADYYVFLKSRLLPTQFGSIFGKVDYIAYHLLVFTSHHPILQSFYCPSTSLVRIHHTPPSTSTSHPPHSFTDRPFPIPHQPPPSTSSIQSSFPHPFPPSNSHPPPASTTHIQFPNPPPQSAFPTHIFYPISQATSSHIVLLHPLLPFPHPPPPCTFLIHLRYLPPSSTSLIQLQSPSDRIIHTGANEISRLDSPANLRFFIALCFVVSGMMSGANGKCENDGPCRPMFCSVVAL